MWLLFQVTIYSTCSLEDINLCRQNKKCILYLLAWPLTFYHFHSLIDILRDSAIFLISVICLGFLFMDRPKIALDIRPCRISGFPSYSSRQIITTQIPKAEKIRL